MCHVGLRRIGLQSQILQHQIHGAKVGLPQPADVGSEAESNKVNWSKINHDSESDFLDFKTLGVDNKNKDKVSDD